jgi:hypothetical protein
MKNILLIILVGGLVLGGGWLMMSRKTEEEPGPAPTAIPTAVTTIAVKESVPLPTEEDIIRTYFNLIDEKRIPEAIEMMSQKAIGDESSKQAWGVQLNSFRSIKVENIEACKDEPCVWEDNQKEFKVSLSVQLDPKAAEAPIPYYGYDEGSNIRWLILDKEENVWKITGLGTGP